MAYFLLLRYLTDTIPCSEFSLFFPTSVPRLLVVNCPIYISSAVGQKRMQFLQVMELFFGEE